MIYIILLVVFLILILKISIDIVYDNNIKICLIICGFIKIDLTNKIIKRINEQKAKDFLINLRQNIKQVKVGLPLIKKVCRYFCIRNINITFRYLVWDNPYLVFLGYMFLLEVRRFCIDSFRKVQNESFEIKYNYEYHNVIFSINLSIRLWQIILVFLTNLSSFIKLIKKEYKNERASNN